LIRQYRNIDCRISDLATIAAQRSDDTVHERTSHVCNACQAQTQFTETFTRTRIIGQHAVRQTMQNGNNYLKDDHLIDAA